MSSLRHGIMVVLSSPSGAGKTTLVNKISSIEKFKISISHTTRKPRTNEKNGKDYFFVDKDAFQELIKNNEFLEYANVFNNYYGTLKTNVLDELEKGENILFDIDWQGAKQLKEKKLNFKLISFFILPPSKKELFDRLKNRDMGDGKIVQERMEQFNKDVLHWQDYDYVVVNDQLQRCCDEIINYIKHELNNKKKDYDKNSIQDHVNSLIS